MPHNAYLLHHRKIAFYCALAHRQSLRHLFVCDCRGFFGKIDGFVLTLNVIRLRHVSVIVSVIQGDGRGKEDSLKLGRMCFNYNYNQLRSQTETVIILFNFHTVSKTLSQPLAAAVVAPSTRYTHSITA